MGFGSFESDTQREQSLNDESGQLARQRMKDANIEIPSHRQVDVETIDASIPRSWHRELFDLEASLEAGEFERYLADTKDGETKTNPGRKAVTSTYKRMKRLRQVYDMQHKAYKHGKPLADEQAKIDALYLESYAPGLSEAETSKMRAEIDDRHTTLVERIAGLTFNKGNQVRFISDDQHAFRMAPGPLLQWDSRSYEPLTALMSEFAPQKKMALLDFQAQPYGTLPLTDEQAQYFDAISRALLGPQGSHDLRLLDSLAPAAYDALVPRIAEFTDPREGGRKDASWLACRVLTPKMIWRLAIEWDKWLFKPDVEELSRNTAGYWSPPVEGIKKQRFTRRQATVSAT